VSAFIVGGTALYTVALAVIAVTGDPPLAVVGAVFS